MLQATSTQKRGTHGYTQTPPSVSLVTIERIFWKYSSFYITLWIIIILNIQTIPFLKKTWNKNRHKHIFQLFEKYKQPKYPTKLGYLHRSTHISICWFDYSQWELTKSDFFSFLLNLGVTIINTKNMWLYENPINLTRFQWLITLVIYNSVLEVHMQPK